MATKMQNTISHLERIQAGCWECSTKTEDGHRISGFGVTSKQAIYNAHKKASAYGDYSYPSFATGNSISA